MFLPSTGISEDCQLWWDIRDGRVKFIKQHFIWNIQFCEEDLPSLPGINQKGCHWMVLIPLLEQVKLEFLRNEREISKKKHPQSTAKRIGNIFFYIYQSQSSSPHCCGGGSGSVCGSIGGSSSISDSVLAGTYWLPDLDIRHKINFLSPGCGSYGSDNGY